MIVFFMEAEDIAYLERILYHIEVHGYGGIGIGDRVINKPSTIEEIVSKENEAFLNIGTS